MFYLPRGRNPCPCSNIGCVRVWRGRGGSRVDVGFFCCWGEWRSLRQWRRNTSKNVSVMFWESRSLQPLQNFLIWHCNNPWTLQWQIFSFLLNVGKYWTSRLWDWVDRNDRMERVISIGQVQQKKVHFERWTTFFRNFSGWTEPIHLILDRNVRKF